MGERPPGLALSSGRQTFAISTYTPLQTACDAVDVGLCLSWSSEMGLCTRVLLVHLAPAVDVV